MRLLAQASDAQLRIGESPMISERETPMPKIPVSDLKAMLACEKANALAAISAARR